MTEQRKPPTLAEMIVDVEGTIKKALTVIDNNAQGICFVVSGQKLVGVITDGDVRRSLLSGYNLDGQIKNIMTINPVSLHIESSNEMIQATLSEKHRHIPLIDDDGCLVDYAFLHRYHQMPVAGPFLGGNELAYVTDCIQSNWISSQGSYVSRFEVLFSKYLEVPYALAVSNGTCALHLAIAALGIGSGDEVLVPDFTFGASVNAILHANATPVLIDIHPETWTIDPDLIEKAINPRTRAIMAVHIYGHPCHMEKILSIAEKHNLLVIEDCAEAIGSLYKGKKVGSFGDAAAFSFFGNKIITTGEGGMVLFRSKNAYERCKLLRDHGMAPNKRYWHEIVGYNYRMTNLQAAIGVAQMERLDSIIYAKHRIGEQYTTYLSEIPEITPQPIATWAESSYWLYTVLVTSDCKLTREDIISKMLRNGIETRPTFYPLHQMPPFRKYGENRDFPISTYIGNHGLSLPSSVMLEDTDIKRVVEKLRALLSIRELIG